MEVFTYLISSTVSGSVACTMLIIFLVYAGVVLPAVWSRKDVRRRAASGVLRQILDAVRPKR